MASEVLQSFITVVFDMVDLDYKLFVSNDNTISITKIYNHPYMKYNIFIHSLWSFFFKTYIPSGIATQCMNIVIHKPYSMQLIDTVLNLSDFTFIRQISSLYNMNNCVSHVQNILSKHSNDSFIKEFIIRKICVKYAHDFELSMLKDNVLLTFMKLKSMYERSNDNNQIMDIPLHNPITKFRIVDTSDVYKYNSLDYVQYVVFKDRHFLSKFVNQVCICIDTDVDIDKYILICLINICKNEGMKKPNVILIQSDILNDNKRITSLKKDIHKHAFVFEMTAKLYNILPCISRYSIVISNKQYPTLKPLSISKCNAIYYLRCLQTSDCIHNKITQYSEMFDRYITNNPFSFANLSIPLKIYRIFDFFDIETNTSANVYGKYLVGSQSTHIVDANESMKGTSHQVDIYQASSSKKGGKYDKIVDMYREIPIKTLYEYYINGNCNDIQCKYPLFPMNLCTNVLFTKEMYTKLWSDHLRYSCPFNTPSPINNTLLFNEFIFQYTEKMSGHQFTLLNAHRENVDNTVVLIDSRENPFSLLSFLFAIYNVNNKLWAGKVYTSSKSVSFYKKHLEKYNVVVTVLDHLNTDNYTIDVYNAILKDSCFWKSIGGKKALIIQDDALLLTKGVESFLDVDYIGAPWYDCPSNEFIKQNINPELVGNGGFSIRDIQISIKICDECVDEKYTLFCENQVEIPEDVYFVWCMNKHKHYVAEKSRALKFSSEQILYDRSIGIHKPWMYNSKDDITTFFAKYLNKHY